MIDTSMAESWLATYLPPTVGISLFVVMFIIGIILLWRAYRAGGIHTVKIAKRRKMSKTLNRCIHEDTEPRLFYDLLHHARRIKGMGWPVADRRNYLAGVLAVYVLQNAEFRLADAMRELHKVLNSGVDY